MFLKRDQISALKILKGLYTFKELLSQPAPKGPLPVPNQSSEEKPVP